MIRPLRPAASGRVLVVAPQPFYEDRGTPIAVLQVLRALSELGHQVDVLTYPVGASPQLPGVRYIRILNPLRIRRVPIGLSLRKLWFDVFLFALLVEQLARERYACIHAVEESAFFAVLAGRWFGVPVIYDMQSSLPEQLAERRGCRNRWMRRVLNACERWLLQRADRVVCSIGLAERARAAAPSAHVREWWYPHEAVRVSDEEVRQLRQELAIRDDQRVVVYTGNFEAYQGLLLLAQSVPAVLARVPNAVFVLVGSNGTDEETVRRALASSAPGAAYRLVLRQPRQRIAAFLAMADVVVSSRTAGGNVPLKVLEYLAAGRAIVATAVPAHRALLTDAHAVLVEATREALAGAIASLLEDESRLRQLQASARAYADAELGWDGFRGFVRELYGTLPSPAALQPLGPVSEPVMTERVSVIIPARNAEPLIGLAVHAALAERAACREMDVIVVDDGSTDDTAARAEHAGARVVTREVSAGAEGNPTAARNLGAAHATGDLLVFLDADCTPRPGCLAALLRAHAGGAVCVGGALGMPPGLSLSSRTDYYAGWYHVHDRRPRGFVQQHPPCNLSIRRSAFETTAGFTESPGIAYAHEELAWQAELSRRGQRIVFEPGAVAEHWNRPGWGNLLRRNYRWAYSAMESKASTRITRWSWLYRYPWLLIALSLPSAPLQALYITGCWLKVGVLEPLVLFPGILAARIAYSIGMMVGGVRWALSRGEPAAAAPQEAAP